MSLRGIDAQIMIVNSAEVAKDTATQRQSTVSAQEFSALQAKAMEEHETQRVSGLEETYKAELKPDKDGTSQNQGGESSGKRREKSKSTSDADDLFVGYNENIVDIIV